MLVAYSPSAKADALLCRHTSNLPPSLLTYHAGAHTYDRFAQPYSVHTLTRHTPTGLTCRGYACIEYMHWQSTTLNSEKAKNKSCRRRPIRLLHNMFNECTELSKLASKLRILRKSIQRLTIDSCVPKQNPGYKTPIKRMDVTLPRKSDEIPAPRRSPDAPPTTTDIS